MALPDDLALLRGSQDGLQRTAAALSDDDVRRPSLLPGWTVAHVLTHVARNADSVVRRLEGLEQGRLVPQYEGGAEGRAAQIEDGAARGAEDLAADLAASSAAVVAAFARLPEARWAQEVLAGQGPGRVRVDRLVFTRRREVEVHHVDLGLGHRPPDDLVRRLLAELLEQLPDRADPWELAAWALGRGPAPELGPWG